MNGGVGSSRPSLPLRLRQRTALTTTLQISKEDTLNPILQDTKKGKLRFVRNCFPHKGYLWNYGAFPQVCIPYPSISPLSAPF